MRTTVFDLLQRLAECDLREPIVEFGAVRVPGQAYLPPIRTVFPGRWFTGVDMNDGDGVDQLHDLRSLGFRDRSIGTALLIDTIEHVEDPKDALAEVRRCVADDGVLLLTTHFFFPIHKFPSDYWRFTEEGMMALLREFHFSHAGEAGLRLFPHTVIGLAGGPDVPPETWKRLTVVVDRWLKNGADTWKERLLSALPPIVAQQTYGLYASAQSRKARRSKS